MGTTFAPDARVIGARIDESIRVRDLKPTRVAAEMGCSESTLRRFIKGENHPSFRQIAILAGLADLPLDYFIGNGKALP